MSKAEKIIPSQEEGAKSDIIERVRTDNEDKAKEVFNHARKRLLSINLWKEISGDNSASFILTDGEGKQVEREAHEGDYFCIDIPGPGNKSGEGFDWVRIEAIEDHSNPNAEEESFGMRVRPSENPANNDSATAHFFKPQASSNFIIKREGATVTATVHGRNEKPNLDTSNLIDKIRNALVGTGAAAGVSKIQWTKLAKGLINSGKD